MELGLCSQIMQWSWFTSKINKNYTHPQPFSKKKYMLLVLANYELFKQNWVFAKPSLHLLWQQRYKKCDSV